MTAALVATAAISVGAVAATLALHPIVAFAAYGLGILVLVARPWGSEVVPSERVGRLLVALAVVAAVADRHLFVSSSGVAPDDVLAAVVVAGALVLPRGLRWTALGIAVVAAAYLVTAAILIAAKPYHSDAVVAAHAGAERIVAGRHPYADFDLVAELARFGLPPEFATPLEDGTRLRSLQYPVLAVLVPAPLVAAGLADIRPLYLLEVALILGIAVFSVAPRWRAFALAAGIGNLAVLDQFVLAGVDPMWALLVLLAWLLRRTAVRSAVLLGLALAARQQAWLVAPFLLVWAWRRAGARDAILRAGVALGVAVLLHLPFLVTAPASVLGGITAPALRPLEPWGIGPAKLAAEGVGPLFPREAYLVAAVAAYVIGLLAFAAGRVRCVLVLPLVPLWLSWRALQSYFAFLPIFAMTEREDRSE